MAYAAGDLILHDHYNVFATGNADGSANHAVANINTIWGVGSGNKGYGQSSVLTGVTTEVVTATQWSTLIGRLNSCLTHQAGAGSGITLPTAGATIAYIAALSGSISTATTNRLNFNNTRGTVSYSTQHGTWTSATPTTFQQVRTVTFGSADEARYFFNAGGRLSLGFGGSGGADTSKEIAWAALLGTKLDAFYFDQSSSSRAGAGGTLTTDGSALGFWDMTTSDQTLIKLTDTTAAYTSNYVEILCRVTGATGSNGGLGNVITFTINYNDAAVDDFDDAIAMTVVANLGITPPETTNLAASWGTVTPAAPTN